MTDNKPAATAGKDYQTHVFTSTYTADVSGVCSAMFELGGMSVLHDPSGCNSTYSTHDEPRWFDSDSLMFVSGLDEVTAVMGDDSVLIRDVVQAARDLKPRFITLCGASIPHIIGFDYRGVAHLIEEACGIPVLPVATDGLKSYTSGVGRALTAWLERFADPAEFRGAGSAVKAAGAGSVNLVGVTPLDFSVTGNAEALRGTFESAGFAVNCCMAMGDTFDRMRHAYRAGCNVVVSSAGRRAARAMKRAGGIPFVEGLPIGPRQTELLLDAVEKTLSDGCDRFAFPPMPTSSDEVPSPVSLPFSPPVPGGGGAYILVIGEEIFARSLACAISALPPGQRQSLPTRALWPDESEGIAEDDLIAAVGNAAVVIADPLYRVVCNAGAPGRFIPFPHEAYSGRMFRDDIPVFAGPDFSVEQLLN